MPQAEYSELLIEKSGGEAPAQGRRISAMTRGSLITIVIAATLLFACTLIAHEKVEGWPELKIVEHSVSTAQMRDRCAPYSGFGSSPMACAEFYLTTGECHIWYSADFPLAPFMVEHERLHCAGTTNRSDHDARLWTATSARRASRPRREPRVNSPVGKCGTEAGNCDGWPHT